VADPFATILRIGDFSLGSGSTGRRLRQPLELTLKKRTTSRVRDQSSDQCRSFDSSSPDFCRSNGKATTHLVPNQT
jgi:hypothetical protein